MDLPARSTHQLNSTREHFLCGAPSECEQEDPLRGDPFLNQVSHAVDEGAGLPRAGAGDNKERTVTKSGCCTLLGVQLLGEVARDRGLDVSGAVVNPRLVHGLNNRTGCGLVSDRGELRLGGHGNVTRGTVPVLARDALHAVLVVTVGHGGLVRRSVCPCGKPRFFETVREWGIRDWKVGSRGSGNRSSASARSGLSLGL